MLGIKKNIGTNNKQNSQMSNKETLNLLDIAVQLNMERKMVCTNAKSGIPKNKINTIQATNVQGEFQAIVKSNPGIAAGSVPKSIPPNPSRRAIIPIKATTKTMAAINRKGHMAIARMTNTSLKMKATTERKKST